jgi:threonine/homoserine/homoserine lactone efflux protein
MEFLRFIKWQWNRFCTDDQILIVSTIVIIAFVIAAVLLDFGLVFSLLSIVGFIATVLIGTSMIRATVKQWKKYNEQMDREKQAVIDKLAGKNTHRSIY